MGFIWNTNEKTKKAYPVKFQDGDQVKDDWIGNMHRDVNNEILENKEAGIVITEHEYCSDKSEAELNEQGYSYRVPKRKKLFGIF